MSTSRIGVCARLRSRWLSVSGTGTRIGLHAVEQGLHARGPYSPSAYASSRGGLGHRDPGCRRAPTDDSPSCATRCSSSTSRRPATATADRSRASCATTRRHARRGHRRLHVGRLRARRIPLGRRRASAGTASDHACSRRRRRSRGDAAAARSCSTTHEFQAPEFYPKFGYELKGASRRRARRASPVAAPEIVVVRS